MYDEYYIDPSRFTCITNNFDRSLGWRSDTSCHTELFENHNPTTWAKGTSVSFTEKMTITLDTLHIVRELTIYMNGPTAQNVYVSIYSENEERTQVILFFTLEIIFVFIISCNLRIMACGH